MDDYDRLELYAFDEEMNSGDPDPNIRREPRPRAGCLLWPVLVILVIVGWLNA